MLEYQNNNGKVGAKILAEQVMFNRSKMNDLMARFGFNTENLSDYELVTLMGDLAWKNKQFVPTLATYINSNFRGFVGELVSGIGSLVGALDDAFKTSDDETRQTQAQAELERAKADAAAAAADAESGAARAKMWAWIGVSAIVVIGAVAGVVLYRRRSKAKANG
jgi:cytochrome b subunit of formate dehydrogenase